MELVLKESSIDGDENEAGDKERIDGAVDGGDGDEYKGGDSGDDCGDGVSVSLAAVFTKNSEETGEDHGDSIENRCENNEKKCYVVCGEAELEDSLKNRDADEETNYESDCADGEHGEEESLGRGNELLVIASEMMMSESVDKGIDEIGTD